MRYPLFFKVFILFLIISIAYNFLMNDRSSLNQPLEFLGTNGFKIFTSNDWIFNWNVSQYSSIIRESKINNSTKLLKFETTIFSDLQEDQASLKSLKTYLYCLILTDQNIMVHVKVTRILPIRLMDISVWKKSKFYRIECELNAHINADVKSFRTAVVDTRYLLDSFKVFQMQTPVYVNTSLPKYKAVASCVHMLRNLDEKRVKHTLDWIRIQKKIGIAKIRIYLLEQNELLLRQVKANYQNFVEIVQYKSKFSELCHMQIENRNRNLNSSLFRRLHDDCQSAYEKHFNMSDKMVVNSHERLQSNDCLLKFKYNYEFVVNYDIDEFILPRQMEASSHMSCNNSIVLKAQTNKYNIYEFIRKLSDSYWIKQVFEISKFFLIFKKNEKKNKHAILKGLL